MKKVLVLLAVLAMTIGANAQGKDYNRVEFSYAPMFMSEGSNSWSSQSITAHGFKAGYVHGFHLSKKWPMYIEAGANLQFNRKTVEESYFDYDEGWYTEEYPVTVLRMNIPVAFTWRFGIGSKKLWKISPYTGFNFGINLLYKMDGDSMFGDNNDYYSANRFQFGLIEGVNFTYKCWNFGINYVIDLMPLDKSDYYNAKNYTGTLAISAGYEF